MPDTTASRPALDNEPADGRLSTFRLRTVLVLSVFLAVVRLASLASSPWDWDEALFALAIQGDYDVSEHRPHPPGFPVYIAAGRLLAPLSGTFEAMQIIVVASAIALFPLMFFVAMEAGFKYRTSLVAACLLASFPNVVVFSGSGFSDVPSLALTLGSVLLLLRGRRSRRAFLVGAVVTALAAGIRVQSILACIAPGILACRRRRFRDVVLAAILFTLLVGAIYGGAVIATGSFDTYQSALRRHGEFIAKVDSFRSATRRPLDEVFPMVLRPWKAGELGGVVLVFAVIALVDMVVKRHAPTALALATFAPFLVLAWLTLDPYSLSRFSIGYMPLHALLAARGIVVIAGMLSRWLFVRENAWVFALGATLSVSLLGWAKDPVAATRADEAPPIAAMTWVRNNLAPGDTTLWIESATIRPFAELELPGWELRPFEHWSDITPSSLDSRRSWVIVEGRNDDARIIFSRTERHLRQVVRDRFFDVSVIPLDETVRFGDGWYDQEGSGATWWRWMQGDASLTVPGSARQRTLSLSLEFPSDTRDVATIEVSMDGRVLDVPPRPPGGTSELQLVLPPDNRERTIWIRVTPTVRPVDVGLSGDDRVLGARLIHCDLD